MAAEWLDLKTAASLVDRSVARLRVWINDANYPKIRVKMQGQKKYVLKSDLLKAFEKIKRYTQQKLDEKRKKSKKSGKKSTKKNELTAAEKRKLAKIKDLEKQEHVLPEFQEIGALENLHNDEFWKDKPMHMLKLREEILKIRAMRIGKENQNKAARKGYVAIKDAMKIQARILHEIKKMETSFLNSWGPVMLEIIKLKKTKDIKKELLKIAQYFIRSWANGWRGNMARVTRELVKQIENQGCIVSVNDNFEVIETE